MKTFSLRPPLRLGVLTPNARSSWVLRFLSPQINSSRHTRCLFCQTRLPPTLIQTKVYDYNMRRWESWPALFWASGLCSTQNPPPTHSLSPVILHFVSVSSNMNKGPSCWSFLFFDSACNVVLSHWLCVCAQDQKKRPSAKMLKLAFTYKTGSFLTMCSLTNFSSSLVHFSIL